MRHLRLSQSGAQTPKLWPEEGFSMEDDDMRMAIHPTQDTGRLEKELHPS